VKGEGVPSEPAPPHFSEIALESVDLFAEAPLREVARRTGDALINFVTWRYGNFGGPGWSGKDYSLAPKDSLDAIFKTHDLWYGLREYANGDAKLVEALQALPKDPKRWVSPPGNFFGVMKAKIYKSAAAMYFNWEVKRPPK
jgi:hypothetical protein